jgi:hypothetical protein
MRNDLLSPPAFAVVRLALVLAGVLILAGCSGMATGGGASGATNEISREDIEARIHLNTYEIVRQLRPTWVRSRGRPSFGDPDAGSPVVYLDETFYGPVASLNQIDPRAIQRIEFMSASDATTRFGTGHMGGVIMVMTTERR